MHFLLYFDVEVHFTIFHEDYYISTREVNLPMWHFLMIWHLGTHVEADWEHVSISLDD